MIATQFREIVWSVGRRAALPVLVFLSVGNAVRLATGGPRIAGDTSRFTGGADALLNGGAMPAKAVSYLGYVAAVAVMDIAELGLHGLVVLQLAFAVAASVAVFDIACEVAGTKFAGFAALLLLALETEHSLWHSYVLTDSLYMSFLAITAWVSLRASDCGGLWSGAALVVAIACLASLRPNGWLAGTAVLLFWAARSSLARSMKLLTSGGVLAALVLCFFIAPPLKTSAAAEDPTAMLLDGRVIWGDRSVNHEMPAAPAGTTFIEYVIQHPLESAHLAAARVSTELVNVRPYYGDRQNLKILATLVPIYALATLGVWTYRRSKAVQLMAALIAVHVLLVAGTFADYDGRFLMHVLPLIIALAGAGAANLPVCTVRRLVALKPNASRDRRERPSLLRPSTDSPYRRSAVPSTAARCRT